MLAPELCQKAFADLLEVFFGNPVPLLPVPLGGKFFEINGADMLNGALAIPVLQCTLALWRNHSIGPSVEEVFPYRGSFLVGSPGDNAINDADGIQLLLKGVGDKQSAEGFGFQPGSSSQPLGFLQFGDDSVGRAEILLPLELDFFPDAVSFAHVPVGSTLEDLFVQMCHVGII